MGIEKRWWTWELFGSVSIALRKSKTSHICYETMRTGHYTTRDRGNNVRMEWMRGQREVRILSFPTHSSISYFEELSWNCVGTAHNCILVSSQKTAASVPKGEYSASICPWEDRALRRVLCRSVQQMKDCWDRKHVCMGCRWLGTMGLRDSSLYEAGRGQRRKPPLPGPTAV